MRVRSILLAVLVLCGCLLAFAPSALAAPGNAGCLKCHGVGGMAASQLDFDVSVDMSKCSACHWYSVHDFDGFHVEQNAAPNYLSQQCNSCHHSNTTFPYRPVIRGYGTAFTPYGWFQSPASVTATAGALHAIHASGSWLKDTPECNSCHGAAACTACHSEPADTHGGHGSLGVREMPTTVRIGRQYGDSFGDTYAYQSSANANYDSGSAMFVGRTGTGEERLLLRIPLSDADGLTVTSATLSLTRSSGAAFPLRAYRLRRTDWVTGQASWNAYKTGALWGVAGAKDAATDYYSDVYAESSTGVFDVTALVNAARAAGQQYLDLVVLDPAPVARRYNGFYSSGGVYPTWYPWLEITGTQPVDMYAYGPVSGTEPGNPDLPAYVTSTRSCIAAACHDLGKADSADFVPTCLSCHPEKGQSHGYDAETHTGSPTDETVAISGVDFGPLACSGCHSVELGAEHVKATSSSAPEGCAACHPQPRWTFSAWAKSCAQGGCHKVGTQNQKHLGIDAAHIATPSPAGCTLPKCHAGSNVAVLHSAATTTVAGVERTSCAVCHADGVPTKKDCTVCHAGDPHGDVSAYHPATVAESCGGPKCHNGTSLTAVHTTTTCVGCHGSADAKVQAAIDAHDSRCEACHSVATAHGDLNAKHTVTPYSGTIPYMNSHMGVNLNQDVYVNCQNCHVSSNASAMHDNDCASCHNGSAPAASFDTWNGSCQQGNCHPTKHPTAVAAHDATGRDQSTCSICHSWDPLDACGGCHTLGDVYPPTSTSDAKSSYVGTATIKISGSDYLWMASGIARYYYRVDGGPKQVGSTVIIAPPASGTVTRTLEFWAVDKAGNFEKPHHVVTFTQSP